MDHVKQALRHVFFAEITLDDYVLPVGVYAIALGGQRITDALSVRAPWHWLYKLMASYISLRTGVAMILFGVALLPRAAHASAVAALSTPDALVGLLSSYARWAEHVPAGPEYSAALMLSPEQHALGRLLAARTDCTTRVLAVDADNEDVELFHVSVAGATTTRFIQWSEIVAERVRAVLLT
jgi:hypothetical protein